VLQKRVGLWVALQLFLFCEGIAKRLCRKLHCRSVYACRLMVALSGFRVADNGPQAGVSFLLIKLTHFKVNTQKITLAWCYISVVAILFY
jgi:hypothetical protein